MEGYFLRPTAQNNRVQFPAEGNSLRVCES